MLPNWKGSCGTTSKSSSSKTASPYPNLLLDGIGLLENSIAQWSADMLAIFFVALPDVWPAGDGAVDRGIRALLPRRRHTGKAAALYRPHRSYLALHIWRGFETGRIPKGT